MFGPQDTKDSINISLFHIDSFTWSELVRAYLDSDKHSDYDDALKALELPEKFRIVIYFWTNWTSYKKLSSSN
jgi:hypothetical protein